MWATRPHLGSIFEKLLHRKTFCLPAAWILQPNFYFAFMSCNVSRETLLLGKSPESGSARLGHIPSLPRESQLPLKPCISLQPLAFQGNCDSSDCFLDFCFISWCRFDLLRKCGLLAHTSPAFLKNCWIKKLLFRLWLVACSRSCTLPLFAENTALSCNLLEIMVQ